MDEQMKIIGRKMSIRMGIMMSFALALVGTLTSGHFTVPGFLLSFVLSAVISLIIGFIVPVGKISADFCRKRNLAPGTLGNGLASSFISDVIYTPIITLVMVAFAYVMVARKQGAPFLPMFLKSLVICFVVGFVLIFIFMPIFLKGVMKNMPPMDGAPKDEPPVE